MSIVVIIIAFMTSCRKVEEPNPNELDNPFPVSVGNWWEWEATDIFDTVTTIYDVRLEIVGRQMINGHNAFVRVYSIYRNDTLTHQDTAYYYIENGYLTKMWFRDDQYYSWRMVKIPLKLHDTWIAYENTDSLHHYLRIAEVQELLPLSVPAGNFENVAKVTYTDINTSYGDSTTVDTSYVNWYLKNDVGIVKISYYYHGRQHIEVLRDYHIE